MAISIVIAFLALNHRAYAGFFHDDELVNMGWALHVPAAQYIASILSPLFQPDNFRPVGSLYFTTLMKAAGENFAPYIVPLFAFHLLNALLVFALARRMRIGPWHALAATAFFTLSAGAMDAYWKPMYVFDLFCTTFCLASILLYAHGRWILSFIAFWLAYKSKELAVMLPVALLAWEHWLGNRRYLRLAPFFAASLSFGLQGILKNPNRDNEYTFRFTLQALRTTIPFYAERLLLFPASGLLLFALALLRDRRIWFALTALASSIFVLLFLPGRLYEAYAYLALTCAALALAAAFSHVKPAWAWVALTIWMPMNVRSLHRQQRVILRADMEVNAYVSALNTFAEKNPQLKTYVFEGVPAGFHDWGIRGAWSIAHGQYKADSYFFNWPEGKQALANETVAYGKWENGALTIATHSP